jgi:hypothetical protein
MEEKKYSRIDLIGQNGNTGEHYFMGESGPLEFSHTPTPTPTPPCVGHSVASDDAEELEYINKVLEFAQQDGLLTEVVYLALKEMRQDPTLSPSEALQFGYSEWCK